MNKKVKKSKNLDPIEEMLLKSGFKKVDKRSKRWRKMKKGGHTGFPKD